MSKLDDIFAAAGKKVAVFELDGGITLHLSEMSISARKKWAEHLQENVEHIELNYAYLISACCEELKELSPEQIVDKISSTVILDVGNKIAEISGIGQEEKKP